MLACADEWKAAIERDIEKLRERISMLELDRCGYPEVAKTLKHSSTADLDTNWKLSKSNKCIHHLRVSRSSRIQCFVLVVFLFVFLKIGADQLERAIENVESEYNPEKKVNIRDYQASDLNQQYEMPYFYFHFYVESNVYCSDDLLAQLLESQSGFNGSGNITYFRTEEVNVRMLKVEDVLIKTGESQQETRGCWAFIRVLYSNPDPSMGQWFMTIHLKLDSMSLSDDVYNVSLRTMLLTVSREEEIFRPFSGIKIMSDDSAVNIYTVSWQEEITERLKKEDSYNLRASGTQFISYNEFETLDLMKVSASLGDSVIHLKPDLLVEYWREYVEYGYWEWFSGMGGLMSILSATFFWLAYYAGLMVGSDNESPVGILSELSFLYANFESILWLKRTLKLEEKY